MATVINNPGTTGDASGSNGMNMIAMVLLILVLAGLFLYVGLPAIRSMSRSSAPTIQVPDKVDVNVNGGGSGQSAPQGGGQTAPQGQ